MTKMTKMKTRRRRKKKARSPLRAEEHLVRCQAWDVQSHLPDTHSSIEDRLPAEASPRYLLEAKILVLHLILLKHIQREYLQTPSPHSHATLDQPSLLETPSLQIHHCLVGAPIQLVHSPPAVGAVLFQCRQGIHSRVAGLELELFHLLDHQRADHSRLWSSLLAGLERARERRVWPLKNRL